LSEARTTGVLPIRNNPIYSREEIHEGLKKVLNQEEPEFRSDEQKESVFAALDRQTPLIVVLPTGGGKTLTFTLPAILLDPEVTIVVRDYVALIHYPITLLSKNHGCIYTAWNNSSSETVFLLWALFAS
jgi:superfamily II DNA helicase RecQ